MLTRLLGLCCAVKGDLTLEQNQKVAIWFVAISMSIFALTSLLG